MSGATDVLTLSCVDRPGVVAAISGLIARLGGNIEEAAQFSDRETQRFFMRVAISIDNARSCREKLVRSMASVAADFGMGWAVHDIVRRPRVMIAVSKFDHCLNDLLYRHSMGELPADIRLIVSNHPEAAGLAARYGVAFFHLPVAKESKRAQELRIESLVRTEEIDLVVLARYMQILSKELVDSLEGRIINIHHSFLPSFKGAKPYHQAFARGVKLIGATAHYVTADLDEGPIIEQSVVRVSHADTPDDLIAAGREVESRVLARAVKLHLQRRVFLNGSKTVVF